MDKSNVNEIMCIIEDCLLQKLTKTIEECEAQPEFTIRIKNLDLNFHRLLSILSEINIKEETVVLASLKILELELDCEGPWNSNLTKEYANKLNGSFAMLFGTSLREIFSSDIFESAILLDTCIKILHTMICADNFKNYPSLTEVYVLLVESIKEIGVGTHVSQILPISLYLIEDFSNPNIVKGLKSCNKILKCLNPGSFAEGNYYEVIYRSLKNLVYVKDLDVIKLLWDCILQFLNILPEDVKDIKTNDVLTIILEQLYIETDLYRKAILFSYLTNIIDMYKVNCVRRKKIREIFCDNIDICCNDAVAEILLGNLLECIEMWVKHCWCVWRLHSNQKLLSLLLKLLYCSVKEEFTSKIVNLLIVLINLCSKAEQKQIILDMNACEFTSLEFNKRLDLVKANICKQ